jgi:flagellar basal body-associated protein FliL
MSDEKKDDSGAGPAAPKAQGSKLMPLLVGFNSLLFFGVVGFMGYSITHPAAPAHAPQGEEHAEEGKTEGGEKKEEGHGGGEKKEEGHGGGEKKGEGAAPAAGAPGPMVKLADFVIHLRNPELDRYARMSFDVEVIGESDKERLNGSLPRVRDAFISYLSDRTLEELRGSEGLGRTKDALQQRLREMVPEARIRALYITDFVVQ